MKIELSPQYRRFGLNVTTAYSTEFAELIRKLETKKSFENIKGEFVITKGDRGKVTIELNYEFQMVA